ncbi:nucleotidyltransferase family protein [uncultured Shewanella sp.]|uniref:nucleotidyltransferase family protein n=1 Tax=uncultured Shewanella sp. TaxID=173975 RepID=UPI00260EA75D|nr:nucleotidyltransferase family protein [uncultured Shewanella sp.]
MLVERIIKLIEQDRLRKKALECVVSLNLPQGYIAAGFVRNLVWDDLHQNKRPTPLNDIDVIYFDSEARNIDKDKMYEMKLRQIMPEINWQVKNQALMHIRNGDRPYLNIVDAMSFWPEKETAVAIRRVNNGRYECLSAFGFDSLFQLLVTHNPKRSKAIFDERVSAKQWLNLWPQLTILSD